MTNLSADLWQGQTFVGPEQVRAYFEHSLMAQNGMDGIHHRDIEPKLSFIVREAMKAGSLDDINWATFPLPRTFLLAQLHRKRGLPFSLSSLAIKTPELPEFLYRVQLPTRVILYETGTLEAQYRFTLTERGFLTENIREHSEVTWIRHLSKRLISFRSSPRNFMPRDGLKNGLKDTQVFKAPNLAETLQIDAPPPTNFGTEYLALHTIPRSAVKCLCTMTVYAVKETVPSRSPSQQPSRPPLKLRRRSPSFDPWKELGWFDNNLEENVESGADG